MEGIMNFAGDTLHATLRETIAMKVSAWYCIVGPVQWNGDILECTQYDRNARSAESLRAYLEGVRDTLTWHSRANKPSEPPRDPSEPRTYYAMVTEHGERYYDTLAKARTQLTRRLRAGATEGQVYERHATASDDWAGRVVLYISQGRVEEALL